MAGTRVSPEALSYVTAVMEAFSDEPAKFEEFKNLLKDMRDHRVDVATGYARVKQLFKDHRNLLIRLNAFLPADSKITIPPAANKRRKLTRDDMFSYITTVMETFKNEPAKFQEFVEIMKHVRTHSKDVALCYPRLKELMKDHRNLLLGLNAFLPPEAKTTIAPEAKKPTLSDARDILKRIKEAFHRSDEPTQYEGFKKLLKDYTTHSLLFSLQQNYPRAHDLVAKVKERFQGDDNHVYESFLQRVRMLIEGNMSRDKVYHEIVTLLQDHQDLVKEFSDFCSQ